MLMVKWQKEIIFTRMDNRLFIIIFECKSFIAPYQDAIIVKADNISIKKLLDFEMFLPFGRFRMDLNLTEGYGKSAFHITSTYFTISDHRIEQF